MKKIVGRVWVFGDEINTDLIFPHSAFRASPEEQCRLCMSDNRPGWSLQVKEGDVWKDVDQSVKGNDFWQCGLDRASGKYYLIYNVKNTVGTAFNTENRYRLIER